MDVIRESPESATTGLEWWYAAQFTVGVVFMGMVPVLVPAFVLDVSRSASAVGVVMAILGLGALAAPAIGTFADRLRAHRLAQIVGLAALVVGPALFAGANEELVFAVAAVVMGLGVATLLMVNPTFIVAGGFGQAEESLRLGRLTQTAVVGQIVGGLLAAGLAAAKVEFEARFWIMCGVAAAGLVVTALTNGSAAQRIATDPAAQAEEVAEEASGPNLWGVLASAFGILVISNFLNSLGHASLQSQFPNFMERVFRIEQSASAATISVGALVTLAAVAALPMLLRRAGAVRVYQGSLVLRLLAFAGLALLVGFTPPSLVPLCLYVLLAVGIVFVDTANPAIAARTSPTTTGTAQGIVMGALALGTFTGGLIGGWLAETVGFDWLPVAGSAGVGAALVLALLGLRGTGRNDAH